MAAPPSARNRTIPTRVGRTITDDRRVPLTDHPHAGGENIDPAISVWRRRTIPTRVGKTLDFQRLSAAAQPFSRSGYACPSEGTVFGFHPLLGNQPKAALEDLLAPHVAVRLDPEPLAVGISWR